GSCRSGRMPTSSSWIMRAKRSARSFMYYSSVFRFPVRRLAANLVAVGDVVLLVVGDLGDGEIFDERENLLHHRLREPVLVRHHRKSELRRLPVVLVANLGDGAIELVVDAVLDAPENHPLFFERMALRHHQRDTTDSDDHGLLEGRRDLFDLVGLDDVADL